MMRHLFLGTVALLAVAACADGPTPRPVGTATPEPTPTATAQPLLVQDGLRERMLAEPVAAAGAPCGVVDVLDPPLGAPDGTGFGVRWPYGRVSRRYQGKLHAGEDWLSQRGPSLGKPVHAVAHGQVTYAQPWGWGTDKGVVIVRHVFADGRTVLSFYGHLDPPSVVTRAGACLRRGEVLGAVGKPRGTAHLHFEIRSHMPDTPGPGYWPTDPERQGWFPPSSFMVDERVRRSPGVLWTRPMTETALVAVGRSADDSLLLLARERELSAVSLADGRELWSLTLPQPARAAVVDAAGDRVYLALRGGGLQALSLPPGEPLWTAEPAAGKGALPLLLSAPGGGLIAHDGRALIGLDRGGARVWAQGDLPPMSGWTLAGDRLLMSPAVETLRGGAASSPVSQPGTIPAGASGLSLVLLPVPGWPLASGPESLIYGDGGVWQAVDGGARAELRTPLEKAIVADGQWAGLPGGGALLAHRSPSAMVLMALDAAGRRVWDRNLAGLGRRPPALIAAGDRVLAIGASGEVLSIDPGTGDATRLLAGQPGDVDFGAAPWAYAAPDGRLVVRLGERLVGVDVGAAAR